MENRLRKKEFGSKREGEGGGVAGGDALAGGYNTAVTQLLTPIFGLKLMKYYLIIVSYYFFNSQLLIRWGSNTHRVVGAEDRAKRGAR